MSDNISTLEKVWASSTRAQKVELLRARGLSPTWADAPTIRDMVNRGGGMAAGSLLSLVQTWRARNPHTGIIFP